MPDSEQTNVTGEVTDIFAHRFVVRTTTGKILADLGPRGAEQVALRAGDRVTLSGEMKPSEVKVHAIQKQGGPSIVLEHEKPHQHHHRSDKHEDADPKRAIDTVAGNGFSIVGGPRRKPKHFEILGKDVAGDFVEFHVEFGGALRKTRPVERDDPKWAAELRNYS
jgi:hypothetical protein